MFLRSGNRPYNQGWKGKRNNSRPHTSQEPTPRRPRLETIKNPAKMGTWMMISNLGINILLQNEKHSTI